MSRSALKRHYKITLLTCLCTSGLVLNCARKTEGKGKDQRQSLPVNSANGTQTDPEVLAILSQMNSKEQTPGQLSEEYKKRFISNEEMPNKIPRITSIPEGREWFKKASMPAQSSPLPLFSGPNYSNPFINLRMFDSAVKDQGKTEMCSAFAVVAIMQNMVNRLFPQTQNSLTSISEAHLWSFYKKPDMYAAMKASKEHFIGDAGLSYLSDMESAKDLQPKEVEGSFKVTTWDFAKESIEIFPALFSGKPVLARVQVTNGWENPPMGAMSTNAKPEALGHIIPIVGFRYEQAAPGNGYFIFKNSAGPNWGDNGYGYLPFEYCEKFTSFDGGCVFAIPGDIEFSKDLKNLIGSP